MATFDEVLATIPYSKTFEINGSPRVYIFSESDRISAAREIIQREEDAKRRLTAADAEVLFQTVRALLGVVDCGKRNAPAVIDAARATLASIGGGSMTTVPDDGAIAAGEVMMTPFGNERPKRTDQLRVGAKCVCIDDAWEDISGIGTEGPFPAVGEEFTVAKVLALGDVTYIRVVEEHVAEDWYAAAAFSAPPQS